MHCLRDSDEHKVSYILFYQLEGKDLIDITRGPFLEGPGNLTGPKSYFEIKVSRKVGRGLTSNEVNFVSS